MPGKYSHNVVLASYSSQGLISLPNDQQIQYFREDSQPHGKSPARTRRRSPSNASKGTASDHATTQTSSSAAHRPAHADPEPANTQNTKRVLIIDSDAEDENTEEAQESIPTQKEPVPDKRPQTPVQVPPTEQQPHENPTKPVEASPAPTENRRSRTSKTNSLVLDAPDLSQYIGTTPRRGRGVRALIEARHNEELAEDLRRDKTFDELSSNQRPRSSGMAKAFVRARYEREAALADRKYKSHGNADAANRLSLHEFLNTLPKAEPNAEPKPEPKARPTQPKPEPRDPQSKRTSQDHGARPQGISVQEFLSMVPAPPEEESNHTTISEVPRRTEPRNSPLVSRLPKTVKTQHREPAASPIRSRVPPEAARIPPASSIPVSVLSSQKRDSLNIAADTPVQTIRASKPDAPVISHQAKRLEDNYDLDFDGFSDIEDSYFPSFAPSLPQEATGQLRHRARSSSLRSSAQAEASNMLSTAKNRVGSSETVIKAPLGASMASSPGKYERASTRSTNRPLTARSLESPKPSFATTSSRTSPMLPSPNASKGGMYLDAEHKLERVPSNSGSWGLPNFTTSMENDDDLMKLFDADSESQRQEGNILIFTSDEEDNEDDLPTPRPAKLEEDVQMATAHWGQISSGREVDFSKKEADTMSELSAVYPPDIGRYTSGGQEGGPLSMALSGMRHGGELGHTYKPQRTSFLRRSVHPSEILQKLRLRSPPLDSGRSGISGISGGSAGSQGSRRQYHPSSSARTRLPKNI